MDIIFYRVCLKRTIQTRKFMSRLTKMSFSKTLLFRNLLTYNLWINVTFLRYDGTTL